MPKDDENELVQTRISKPANDLLTKKVNASALSRSAWVRRLIYKELGLLKEEN